MIFTHFRRSLIIHLNFLTATLALTSAYSQLPSVINLDTTTANIEILGAEETAWTGRALASGDFNGDEFIDIVVSCDGIEPLGGTRKGEFDIIWGTELQTSGIIDLSNSNGISRIFGKSDDEPFHSMLASGDFNNDGLDDIIIGQPFGQPPWSDGLAYVVFGLSNFPDTLDLQTNPENVVTIYGGPWGGMLGLGVCSCDFNGDGYDDIIVSAPALAYGEVYIIQGTDTLPNTLNMGIPEPNVTRIIDDDVGRGFGRAFSCRDINKDSYDDLLIGAPGDYLEEWGGMVTLVYGEGNLPDTIALANTTFTVKRIFSEYSHAFLGYSLAIGDVNRDNTEDLVIAAPAADPLGVKDCGEVYIFYNADNLPESTIVNTPALPITRIIGSEMSSKFGTQVLCDDFSGDGYADVVLSCKWISMVQSTRDTIVIFYGTPNPPDSIFVASDTTVSRIIADNHQDDLGSSAMTSSDYNKDSLSDLVLGARSFDVAGMNSAGKVYLFYGIGSSTGIPHNWPPQLVLMQNYPNPFQTRTLIEYSLNKPSSATLTIYNILGQQVAQTINPWASKRINTFTWDGQDDKGQKVASGFYIYRLDAGGFSQAKKMLLLR